MLIAVLLSLPMASETRAAVSPFAAGRVMAGRIALSPDQVLPAEIIRRLCAGIRYESETSPVLFEARSSATLARPSSVRGHAEPQFEALVVSMIDLPPPSARR